MPLQMVTKGSAMNCQGRLSLGWRINNYGRHLYKRNMRVCKKGAEPPNTMRLNVWCSVSIAEILMASPPLRPLEPPYTMRLNVW